MTYKTEFPDFAADTLPAIPEGFADVSWRNDACPSFHNAALALTLWVDYQDAERREFPESPRYSLTWERRDAEGVIVGEARTLIDSDEWAEVAERIAAVDRVAVAFARTLAEWFTPDQWREMCRRNATPEYGDGVCASHDFCDANEPMADAFAEVMGRPLALSDDSPDQQSDFALWGAAWDVAKRDYLTASEDWRAAMSEPFARWIASQPNGSALIGDASEMLMGGDLDAFQRQWVSRFVVIWEATEAAEGGD